MILIKVINQHRRDFQGLYECEFRSEQDIDSGFDSYDDRYFHDTVIPNKKCRKCHKSTKSENAEIKYTPTKYPDGYQV